MAGVPEVVVEAAMRAAADERRPIAEVSLTTIAGVAGMSRSTLVRRLGGSRSALDAAVRERGIDPGGRAPLRERAVELAATVLADEGLGAFTLERIAREADCALPSLREAIGGRDALLHAVFSRYGPLDPIADVLRDRAPDDLPGTVHAVLTAIVDVLDRPPQVVPAVIADALARPSGPAAAMMAEELPRVLATLGPWLSAEVDAGRIRPWPLPLLVQQLIAPTAIHLLSRRSLPTATEAALPSVPEVIMINTDAFLAAVTPDRRDAR